MRSVYFDVENTLNVPFITGIQRVTREFSKIVLQENNGSLNHRYIPVVYDHQQRMWRCLTHLEKKSLLSSTPRSVSLTARGLRKISSLFPRNNALYIKDFETNSIFLDIDSSWHSHLKREQLLPKLKQSGVKIAKLHYDIIPLLFPDTTHPDTLRVFSEHFLSHLKYADLFLCISKTSLADVSLYCEQHNIIPVPSMRTILLGTGARFAATKKSAISLNLNTKNYGRYLLSVGTIEPRKNHTLLLNAFGEIITETDLNLVIVGKKGWLADDLLKEIYEHSAYGARIFHLDQVSDSYLDKLYQNAWLNVTPSLYEGYGLAITEALARGCPTICASAGSLKEIGASHVQCFSPIDEVELSTLILNLYFDNDSYYQLQCAAKDYKPIPWEKMTENIEKYFAAIL